MSEANTGSLDASAIAIVDALWEKARRRREHLQQLLTGLNNPNGDDNTNRDSINDGAGTDVVASSTDDVNLAWSSPSPDKRQHSASQRLSCSNEASESVSYDDTAMLGRSTFQNAVHRMATSLVSGTCTCPDQPTAKATKAKSKTKARSTKKGSPQASRRGGDDEFHIACHDEEGRHRFVAIIFLIDAETFETDDNTAPHFVDYCTRSSHSPTGPSTTSRLSIAATCVAADVLCRQDQIHLWANRKWIAVYNAAARRLVYFRWSRRKARLVPVDDAQIHPHPTTDISIWDIFEYPHFQTEVTSDALLE